MVIIESVPAGSILSDLGFYCRDEANQPVQTSMKGRVQLSWSRGSKGVVLEEGVICLPDIPVSPSSAEALSKDCEVVSLLVSLQLCQADSGPKERQHSATASLSASLVRLTNRVQMFDCSEQAGCMGCVHNARLLSLDADQSLCTCLYQIRSSIHPKQAVDTAQYHHSNINLCMLHNKCVQNTLSTTMSTTGGGIHCRANGMLDPLSGQ